MSFALTTDQVRTLVAILVDGTGKTKEVSLPERLPVVRIPRPCANRASAHEMFAIPAALADDTADFYWVGDLPDGRTVYGYRFPSAPYYELWWLRTEWTWLFEWTASSRCFVDMLFQHERAVAATDGAQIVRLFDGIQHDHENALSSRLTMGVARRFP